MSQAPRIAVVVMSYGLRRTLADAVKSVQRQDVPAEIVVVHSGPGDVRSYLAEHGVDVRVATSEERLLPGGARNRGIAETSAPLVAFLADDCMAAPGWLAARLKAHDEGAAAVASALLCHRPRRPVALAAHVSLFVRRMPRADVSFALKYGASYSRELFARYGLFRDDMEGGEDTEFHRRLAEDDKPVWRPEIQTVHVGVDRLVPFLREQNRRGRRMAVAMREIGAATPREVARNAVQRTSLIIRESRRLIEREHRWTLLFAVPFIVAGNVSYAWGAWRAGRTR